MFLMLNPSTADESKNDPTVERCERWARSWGYGGLLVCNLFAFRATDPIDMKAARDPVGPDNDAAILECADRAGKVICGWGNHGGHLGRSSAVRKALAWKELHCLRITQAGEPQHPLYLPNDIKPIKLLDKSPIV